MSIPITSDEYNTDEFKQTIKQLALLEELDTSAKLIRLGLGELQNLDSTNDFYFLPFQLLSQGFERLMKAYICLGYLNKNARYPDANYIKDLGHDLEELNQEILSAYFIEKNHPVLQSDKDFLNNDNDLKELLYILSEFGKKARYYNFNIITENKVSSINPQDRWIRFENRVLFSNSHISQKLGNWDIHHEIHGDIAQYIIIIFEKFISALSRQFIFSCLGEKAKQLSNPVFDFAMLYSKDYGNKDYRKQTTRFIGKPKKIHKRNFIDGLNRKFNSNYKSKHINKNTYNGDWPFYADEVTVECRHKNWCIITIEGYDYALNGSAQGRYKLESPHNAGVAIIGKSVSDFITIAHSLSRME